MTPIQEQYQKIKSEYEDFIILFRLGDFYETFNEDAIQISKVLGITLTSRGKDANKTPLAGIPYHALANYMPKMVEAGLKVVIAEQMEEAVPGKLVERKVTKVITPGTVMDENSLDSTKNNYIACFNRYTSNKTTEYLLAYSDLTTGLLHVFSSKSLNQFKLELNKINPSEILVSSKDYDFLKEITSKPIEKVEDNKFEMNYALECLLSQLGVLSLKGYGLEGNDPLVIVAGVLINYLKECQKGELKHLKSIKKYSYSDYMQLDTETIRNLELIYSTSGNDSNTLYAVLNKCSTSMGKRNLRKWLIYPLINKDKLIDRLESVESFYSNPILSSDLSNTLNNISDIERISGRIGVGSASPRDLIALKQSLISIKQIAEILNSNLLSNRLKVLVDKLISADSELNPVINKIIETIDASIDNEPAATLSDVGIIKTGFNTEIDEIRSLRQNSKQVLSKMQTDEASSTGITSLKISFNQVFGYYIEITKTHLNKVPSHYIRKQTLANAERFITPELKELEEKILSSEEKLIKLEQAVFLEIRNKIAECLAEILEVAEIIAEIDCYISFAKVAKENRYIKPILIEEDKLEINNSRHPVIERIVNEFTSNSASFSKDNLIHILTGPNMSGKSTYIRQIALITLMAQIGSFVPADSMSWNIVDRIFTRVGATDNLSKGESTFMVEMNETANILNNATSNSLIILDEVGRGTSTYDGVAIAWSIIEYIFENLKSKTLFATHYHELINLESQYKGICNYNVEVLEVNGEIMFKHKIVKGGTNRSYGVHVAKLAGIPNEVLEKADKILKAFENESSVEKTVNKSNNKSKSKIAKPKAIHPEQLGLI